MTDSIRYVTEHTGITTIYGNHQPITRPTPDEEDKPMTAYRDRLEAGEYANDGPEAALAPDRKAAAAEADEELRATQAAQARADDLGVDLASVQGSGKDGRVTVGDVEDAYENAASESE